MSDDFLDRLRRGAAPTAEVEAYIDETEVWPASLDLTLVLARYVMRRHVAGEIDAEDATIRIEFLSIFGDLDDEIYQATAALWNFRVYRRYFSVACETADWSWYDRIAADVRAEAEFHLGLRDRPPG